MRSEIKNLAAALLGLSLLGVVVGLAIAQQLDNDGLTADSGVWATGDTDPPPQPSAIKARSRAVKAGNANIAPPAGFRLTGTAAETERRMTTYRGTVVDTNDRFGLVPLQKSIAAAFTRLDPKSPDRSSHFEWVDRLPALNPVGWSGKIVKVEPAPDGVVAEIQFAPIFAPHAKSVTTFDKCVERWLYRAGTLEQIAYPHVHSPAAVGSIIMD